MNTPINTADAKYVIIENGQRISAPFETREEAEKEKARRLKLAESSGQQNLKIEIKQNIFG